MILALIPFIIPLFVAAISGFIVIFLPDLLTLLMSFIPDLMGNASAQVLQYSGFAAWVAQKLRFVECLQVVTAWLGVRLAISTIPFIRRFV